ncbi:hypothetical protein [Rhizobium leucaenae]|uniref:hypothetical protein n=1 Tax=Rhizobium leucaenae TaxID=29450 RepID=UPI00160AE622|nr:hypothetical protein [Rhizobium leucaenae]MBB6299409.1 hypothetical protein [Rhizobium leucaenae]
MAYPNDILELIDNVQSAFGKAKTIEEAEAAWDHFHLLEGYVERTWPHERTTVDALRRLKSGLSTFTLHVRQKMPSPYSGWGVDLSSLRSHVSPKYDKDGWPL